jgi:hypothetical protein
MVVVFSSSFPPEMRLLELLMPPQATTLSLLFLPQQKSGQSCATAIEKKGRNRKEDGK